MKIRYRKRDLIYYIVVIFMMFYSYFTTYQDFFFGSRMMACLLVLIVSIMAIIYRMASNCKITKKIDLSIFWMVLFVFSIFNNQDLKNDSQTRWLLPMAGIFAFYALKENDAWRKCFIEFTKILVKIHAFFTIFFYLFKDIYLNYFIKLVPGNHSYLIGKFNQGCMPGITSHYSTNGIYLGFGLVFFMAELIVNWNQYNNKQLITKLIETSFVFIALFLTAKRAHILFAAASAIVMYFDYNSNKKESSPNLCVNCS